MISAIVIAGNSEDSIARTLESISWCDEIILIDDFSTDRTPDIAASFHAHIFNRHLRGDFAAQRNFGLSKAGGEWILFVDSDEVVSPALAAEIRKAVTIDCNGFYMRREDVIFGKKILHGETGNVRLLRLARSGTGSWVRSVHEVWDVKGVVGTLVQPLVHYPHPNVAQFVSEINTYSTLNAQYLFRQGVRVQWWHLLAYPGAKFFIDFVWLRGFLDGTPGAVIALMMSMHSFLTRAKLWLLYHKQ